MGNRPDAGQIRIAPGGLRMNPALGSLDEMIDLARCDTGRLRVHSDDKHRGGAGQNQQGFRRTYE